MNFPMHFASVDGRLPDRRQPRSRPILMTSIAFILGVLPLVFANGAAAASRRALGTAVCGGMLAATILAVFFAPVFYMLCQHIANWFSTPEALAERRELRKADV